MLNKGNNPVFVYGILKGRQESLVGTVPNFRLIDMGWFPAAIPATGEHQVKGELIHVDDATIEYFDRVEGAPDFYARQEVEVVTEDGQKVAAEMYVINSDHHEAPSLKTVALEIEENEGNTFYEYSADTVA